MSTERPLALTALTALVVCSCSSPRSTVGGSVHDGGGDRAVLDAGTRDRGSADAVAEVAVRDAAARARDGATVDATLDTARPRDAGPTPFFDAGPGCACGDAGEPADLRCTGLYADWATKSLAPGIRPYTPGLQLWSDGAAKKRWIYLPPGESIDTRDMNEWRFPVGTKLWKEFNLPTEDSRGALRRVETRLIWKLTPRSWYLTTYRWSPDGETDARELVAGQEDANGLGYEVPPQGDCQACHQGRVDFVMGFEAVSLAHPGALGFALPELLDAGRLSDPPAPGSLDVPGDPTQAAALGFLHVNCGVACHNGNHAALASDTGFFMRLDVDTLRSVRTTHAWRTGWNQPCSTLSLPGVTERIEACSPETSAAYYFAGHRLGVDGYRGPQMPPIDSHRIDDAGLAVFGAWVDEGCDGGETDARRD